MAGAVPPDGTARQVHCEEPHRPPRQSPRAQGRGEGEGKREPRARRAGCPNNSERRARPKRRVNAAPPTRRAVSSPLVPRCSFVCGCVLCSPVPPLLSFLSPSPPSSSSFRLRSALFAAATRSFPFLSPPPRDAAPAWGTSQANPPQGGTDTRRRRHRRRHGFCESDRMQRGAAVCVLSSPCVCVALGGSSFVPLFPLGRSPAGQRKTTDNSSTPQARKRSTNGKEDRGREGKEGGQAWARVRRRTVGRGRRRARC
jgi:hypothetical protein